MKTYRMALIVMALTALWFWPVRADARTSWSVGVFYEPLRDCGHWVDVAPYGRCWYPSYVSHAWRPYCDGYWMWTDYGWYWVSYEPWAWATYHYGRWVYHSYHGWLWVPDTEWGPSWVSWREGGDYVGWAPLSPGCEYGRDGVLMVREDTVPADWFVFVDVHRFAEPISYHKVIVHNTTIINKTVIVTRIARTEHEGVVVNHGPKFATMEKYGGRKLTTPPPGEPSRVWAPPPVTAQPTPFEKRGSRRENVAPVPPASRETGRERPPGREEPKHNEPVIARPVERPAEPKIAPPVAAPKERDLKRPPRATPPAPPADQPDPYLPRKNFHTYRPAAPAPVSPIDRPPAPHRVVTPTPRPSTPDDTTGGYRGRGWKDKRDDTGTTH